MTMHMLAPAGVMMFVARQSSLFHGIQQP